LNKYHRVVLINLSKGSFKQGISSFKRIIRIARVLKEVWVKSKDADVIYITISQSFSGNIRDILFYLICFKSLSRVIIHLHGGGIRNLIFDKNRFLKKINRFFIIRLGGVIVLGQSLVTIFSDMIPKQRVHIVAAFAENYLFLNEEKIENKFQMTSPLRILFMSNLIIGKGHEELIDAYHGLSKELQKMLRIDFAGSFESDSDEKKFLKKVDGFERIHYHGIVEGAEKKDLFARAHIFCLPTYYYYYEGQPISILEAYASGCAVITTDHGGIRDIFKDGINGFEVQKKSSKSIKLVIEKIIDNIGQLLPMALSNRKTAHNKYRQSNHISSMLAIIERERLCNI